MNHLPFTLSTLGSELWQPIAEDFCDKKYQKIALVVQGGGQRGIFTAGVLDAFLEAKFDPFQLYIGTSAGALNLSSFISRQEMFGYNFITQYTSQDNFFSLYKYLSQQRSMDLDWALDIVAPDGSMALDFSQAQKTLVGRKAFACATRKDSLQDIYLPMYQDNWRDVLRASCAIPVLYQHPVNIGDLEWVDGGVSAAIPAKEAWRQGADLVVIIRTESLDIELDDESEQSAIQDWKDRLEQELPEYVEKLNLQESLDKFRVFHSEISERFSQWKNELPWRDLDKTEQELEIEANVTQATESINKKGWLTQDNIERFLKLAGYSRSAEVIEMLTRYYETYKDMNDFIESPPAGLDVIQIAPEAQLKSRALLSNADDLEMDYRQGKLIGREFVKHYGAVLKLPDDLPKAS